MTNTDNHSTSNKLPKALNKTKIGISTVWIIPIIAALIGGWMVFKSAFEIKAIAKVTFVDASGLEVGKTAVKFRDIKIGELTELKISDDLTKVIAIIKFKGVKQKRLTTSTRFWVVKPRIGLGGISGLDTLISGAYIEVDPGIGGQPTNEFIGLETPDIYQIGNAGTIYTLQTNKLGSLFRGSPVKFRGINVGNVTKYKLTEDHSRVEIQIFIEAPHDKYITNNTRFWNISGIQIEMNAEGIKFDMESVVTLVSGGISFSTANNLNQEMIQAKENTVFRLYQTEKPKIEEIISFGVQMKLYFADGVSGLSVGAPVEFKGFRVGTVVDVGAEEKWNKTEILTYAMIDIEPDRLPVINRKKFSSDKLRKQAVHKFITTMVNRGMRAQLKIKNLITQKSLITMDFFPTAKKETVKYINGIPVLPTVPKSLNGILRKVDNILTKIDAMPIEEMSKNLDQTMVNINNLVKSLNATEGGMMGLQIDQALTELRKAARSIRAMAEYLERHPEALLKGKSSH
ncbi:MAG: intermembrane transport protein PqiB [Gammaproteobacteria bacterium]